MRRSLPSLRLIESDVELQNIDLVSPEKTQPRTLNARFDDLTHRILRHAPRSRHPTNLNLGPPYRNVGIETRTARRNQLRGNVPLDKYG